jgi:hypothetical protein
MRYGTALTAKNHSIHLAVSLVYLSLNLTKMGVTSGTHFIAEKELPLLDEMANVYVTWSANATLLGPDGQEPLNPNTGADFVLLKLDSNGSYQWHTFYRGKSRAITVTQIGNLYVAGFSQGPVFGPDGPLTPINAGGWWPDILVLKLSQNCSASPAKIETGSIYSSFSEAYTTAESGNSILMQAMMFDAPLSLPRDVLVNLKGGYYECDFSSRGAFTTIPGLTISGTGTVFVESLIIK